MIHQIVAVHDLTPVVALIAKLSGNAGWVCTAPHTWAFDGNDCLPRGRAVPPRPLGTQSLVSR
jgi:hypothetical protein